MQKNSEKSPKGSFLYSQVYMRAQKLIKSLQFAAVLKGPEMMLKKEPICFSTLKCQQ